MAHECPECGLLCHCNGDIDDCMFNFDDDVNNCTHYLSPDCGGYDSTDGDFDSDYGDAIEQADSIKPDDYREGGTR